MVVLNHQVAMKVQGRTGEARQWASFVQVNCVADLYVHCILQYFSSPHLTSDTCPFTAPHTPHFHHNLIPHSALHTHLTPNSHTIPSLHTLTIPSLHPLTIPSLHTFTSPPRSPLTRVRTHGSHAIEVIVLDWAPSIDYIHTYMAETTQTTQTSSSR